MRPIDADALIDKSIELYCKDCDRRKGIKNGKWRIVYEIGDAPCRACGIDDMKDDIEDAPTIEPKRGKWIKRKDAMGKDIYICSNCETEVLWRDMRGVLLRVDMQNAHFCPNCGAKMTEDNRKEQYGEIHQGE